LLFRNVCEKVCFLIFLRYSFFVSTTDSLSARLLPDSRDSAEKQNFYQTGKTESHATRNALQQKIKYLEKVRTVHVALGAICLIGAFVAVPIVALGASFLAPVLLYVTLDVAAGLLFCLALNDSEDITKLEGEIVRTANNAISKNAEICTFRKEEALEKGNAYSKILLDKFHEYSRKMDPDFALRNFLIRPGIWLFDEVSAGNGDQADYICGIKILSLSGDLLAIAALNKGGEWMIRPCGNELEFLNGSEKEWHPLNQENFIPLLTATKW
jgi:NADH:ubiquinone oxidoreductase subunit 3 (subunit A)